MDIIHSCHPAVAFCIYLLLIGVYILLTPKVILGFRRIIYSFPRITIPTSVSFVLSLIVWLFLGYLLINEGTIWWEGAKQIAWQEMAAHDRRPYGWVINAVVGAALIIGPLMLFFIWWYLARCEGWPREAKDKQQTQNPF